MFRLVDRNGVTAAVDPAEPGKVLEAAKKEGVEVKSVLTTHHHWYASTPLDGSCLLILLFFSLN